MGSNLALCFLSHLSLASYLLDNSEPSNSLEKVEKTSKESLLIEFTTAKRLRLLISNIPNKFTLIRDNDLLKVVFYCKQCVLQEYAIP